MTRATLVCLLALTACKSAIWAQAYLTPLDFGLKVGEHGMVDYQQRPPNILIGKFNQDNYPDILRFSGSKLELFLFSGSGYPVRPQQQRYFDKPILSLRLGGVPWNSNRSLIVTLEDGSERSFDQSGGMLDMRGNEGFLPQEASRPTPPRQVSSYDFQLVWESDPKPYGMCRIAVGDLDNDAINELATFWKETENGDSAWILIYKCIGDNQYELFMEEPLYTQFHIPGLSYMLIGDLDQNGQMELIYMYDRVYIWEFSDVGIYAIWNTTISLLSGVPHAEICDVDQDGRLEIAMIALDVEAPQPTIYYVKEFQQKNELGSQYVFYTIWELSQYWPDANFSVGDFDNDGTVDIVSGNYGYVIGYDPVDLQYFRYSSGFQPYWLQTGLPLSCATPVIADLDLDGDNELFAGGLFWHGGSAFVWEGTGLGTGYASWIDTTSMYFGPNESGNGMVDWNPAVISLINDGPSGELHLFGLQDDQFGQRWESPMPESTTCNIPLFLDMDEDGKMDICMGGTAGIDLPNRALDYEQVSSGIEELPPQQIPHTFYLHPIYPNPFNATAKIIYQIPRPSDISLRIFNIVGQEVYRKIERKSAAGRGEMLWDAAGFPSAIYLIRLEARGLWQWRKAVLLK
jgi:hypothetical protein